VKNQPRNLGEIIGSGSKVIITIATAGSDKRVRIGRIIEYDGKNRLLTIQQEDDTMCLVPLGSISSIETIRADLHRLKALGRE